MPAPPLPPGQQLAAANKWPLVGEKSPRKSSAPWQLAITGLVATPRTWSLETLAGLPQTERIIDIHCVTRWSKLGMRFRGIELSTLLDAVQPQNDAKYLICQARSERNHHTSLALEEALELGAFIALAADDAPLTSEHGGPVRMVVPGKYFYKSVKWLEAIVLQSEDAPGYWEAQAGYHNHADPWSEERYEPHDWLSMSVDERLRLFTSRKADLRGFHMAGQALPALQAARKLLRDSHFENAVLHDACFDHANLSNAHFEFADLQRATFRQTDVEGANFSGANLCGTDFSGASLFGASFYNEDGEHGARFDAATLIEPAAIEQLTPVQANYVRKHLPATQS